VRITRFVPEEIGKFGKGSPALDVPDDPFVVVYGTNETGKSTYSDMAVTLLSLKYDPSILSRYRPDGVSEPALRGSIVLEEDGVKTTVSFAPKAKIPEKIYSVPRIFNPDGSIIAGTLGNLPDGIVRHLFRLDSVEVSSALTDKSEPVKKFIEYAKGNKAGAKVTELLADWRNRSAAIEKSIPAVQRKRDDLEISLETARQTTTDLIAVEKKLDCARQERTELRDRLQLLAEEANLISFSKQLRTYYEDYDEARKKLGELQDSGDVLPEAVDEIVPYLRECVNRLKDNALEAKSAELERETQKLDEQDRQVAELCARLGIERDQFEQNRHYETEESTTSVNDSVKDQGRKARNLSKSLQDGSEQLIKKKEEREREKFALSQRDEEWKKWSPERTPQEFLRSGPASFGSPTGEPPKKTRPPYLSLLVSLIVAGVAFGMGQVVIGAMIIGSTAFAFALARRSAGRGLPTAKPEGSSLSRVEELADEIVKRQAKIDVISAEIFDLEQSDKKLREEDIPSVVTEADKLVREIDAHFSVNDSEEMLKTWCNQLSDLARAVREHREQSTKVDGLRVLEGDLRNQFNKDQEEVTEALERVGAKVAPERMSRPSALLETLNDIANTSEKQKELRRQVKKYERERARAYQDDSRVEDFLDPGIEDARTKEISESKVDLEGKIGDKDQGIFGLEQEAKESREKRQLQDINSEIASIDRSIRDSHIEKARLLVQAKIVEDEAKKISGLTLPRLLDRLNKILRSVAPEWTEVVVSEDGSVRISQGASTVTGENLSRGARSLLATAMRLVIMQVEAEESNLRLPLLCDDPLIHLDIHRLGEILSWMKDNCDGHQIIYFTCKKEVQENALRLGIPVIDLV